MSRGHPNDVNCPGKTRRIAYTESHREVMDAWMSAHVSEPYLSADERKDLAEQTGLSEKQVANYASDYRRRKLPR